MKKNIILLVSVLLIACANNSKNNATKKIAEIWSAKDCSKDDSQKTITLTIEEPKKIEANYPNENMTSMSAFTYINESKPEDYKTMDSIKVIIKEGGSNFEKNYKITDVVNAKGYFEIIDAFSAKIITGNLNGIETYFDKQIISDSIITKIKTGINDLSKKNGAYTKSTIVFFDVKMLEKTNEPILVTNFVVSNNEYYTDIKVIFRQSDKKIIFFGLN